jgi:GT2 family glycosyltransferase
VGEVQSQPDRPQVAVIVPVRNAGATIEGTVRAVLLNVQESGLRGEVIVVDDASTDDTAAVVRGLCHSPAGLRYVRRGTRGGPNAARNTGVQAAIADTLAFVDGDDEPLPGWLARLVRSVDNTYVIASGAYVGVLRGGRVVESSPEARRAFGFPSIVGGNMAFHRALFDRVGGFDENIMRGGTEVEFCIRAQALFGAHVVPVPEARVAHRTADSLRGRWTTEYGRQIGHAYVQGSLHRQGIEVGLAADMQESKALGRASAWRTRAARSGWPLFVAGLGGRVTARVAGLLMPRPASPQRRGAVTSPSGEPCEDSSSDGRG